MTLKITPYLKRVPDPLYLLTSTLFFYLLLTALNPSNKIIAGLFVFLFAAYYIKIKRFAESLLLTYFSSLIIETGKTYQIQLLPPGIFPLQIYPQGFFQNIVVTATHFIAFTMLILVIRKLVEKNNNFKFNILDALILIFYFLKVVSGALSYIPQISLPVELLMLEYPIAYFFARLYIRLDSKLLKNIVYILAGLVLFETVLGGFQLINKSPLGKNIEYQTGIEYFGNTIGETPFTFRSVGTFDHANSLGIWAAAVSILLLTLNLKFKSSIVWAAVVSGLGLMIVTISRSAWLGLLVGLVFITAFTFNHLRKSLISMFKILYRWRLVLVPCGIILLFVFIIPRIESSFYSFQSDAGAAFFRKIQLLDSINLINLHPLIGIGTFMEAYQGLSLDLNTAASATPLAPHNWFVMVALENGIPAVLVFILFIVLSLRKIFFRENLSLFFTAMAASIITMFTAALFQPYMDLEIIFVLLSLTNGDKIRPKYGKARFKTA